MNSGGITYDETLPAHAEAPPAFGEALPVVETADERPDLDRGKDWPLAFAVFAPVIAAYCAIAYALYLAIGAI